MQISKCVKCAHFKTFASADATLDDVARRFRFVSKRDLPSDEFRLARSDVSYHEERTERRDGKRITRRTITHILPNLG